MKAAVLTQYQHFEWQENLNVPKINADEVLVKVEYAGICGSDIHIFNGDFEGRTKLPLIPGHEFSGIIHQIGKNVKDYQIGDKVVVDPIIWCGQCAACKIGHYPACTSLKLLGIDMNGGFGEYINVHQNMLFKIPESVSTLDAALIEVYSIGFHACNRAQVKDSDTIVIWGSGRIGQSILQAIRTKTTNTIFCVDILPARLEITKKAYPDIVTINLLHEDPLATIHEITHGQGVDIAFEAVGHAKVIEDRPNPIQGCIKAIRGAGTVCLLGLGDEPIPILTKELIWKEGKIMTSRVSHGEFAEAIYYLEKGTLKPEVIISEIFPAEKAQHAFEFLIDRPQDYIKILLKL